MSIWNKEKQQLEIRNKTDVFALSARLNEYFDSGKTEPVILKYESAKPKRSNPQNSYYWSVVIAMALKFYTENVRAFLSDLMKATKFAFTREFVHELFKMLFNGGKTTTKHKTDTFSNEYINRIREHFYHEHEFDIPPPNELPVDLTTKDEVESERF